MNYFAEVELFNLIFFFLNPFVGQVSLYFSLYSSHPLLKNCRLKPQLWGQEDAVNSGLKLFIFFIFLFFFNNNLSSKAARTEEFKI